MYVYRRVSFSAVDIVISKEEEIVGPKILKQQYLFLVEGLLSSNQFKPVLAETVKNYPARKLELLSPKNRYICGI